MPSQPLHTNDCITRHHNHGVNTLIIHPQTLGDITRLGLWTQSDNLRLQWMGFKQKACCDVTCNEEYGFKTFMASLQTPSGCWWNKSLDVNNVKSSLCTSLGRISGQQGHSHTKCLAFSADDFSLQIVFIFIPLVMLMIFNIDKNCVIVLPSLDFQPYAIKSADLVNWGHKSCWQRTSGLVL